MKLQERKNTKNRLFFAVNKAQFLYGKTIKEKEARIMNLQVLSQRGSLFDP